MNHRTVTAVFPSSRDEVFGFVAELDNLPRWATEFARELKYEDGKAKVVNNLGEFYFEIAADARSGVIDMYAGPDEQQMALFPTRVVGLPGGGSAYSFTMFQSPDMPDEVFESQHQSLLREFDNLHRELGE